MRIEDLYSIYLQHPEICTDTRKISTGCLFFALKGDNFDGNQFAEQALQDGAAFVVIDDPVYNTSGSTLLVDDALTALQQLAAYHRKQLKIPVIGITGTNGKTTTKELIKSVLSVKYNTYATPGNLNNHIGVPLTLLAIDNNIEIAIIEMGANHQKEIEALCKIAQPAFGLITNVGKGHLEGFGGFEGVKKGKGELYDFLKETGGLVFLNQSNSYLAEMVTERNVKNLSYYNTKETSGLKGELVENDPFLVIDWSYGNHVLRVKTNLTGPYNLENILAAIAIGKHFNLSDKEINQGIASYTPGNNRSQITKTTLNTLICDYYNANPSSMIAALDNFSDLDADNKIVILGDMFELGKESLEEHKQIVEKAKGIHSHEQIFIGENFFENKTAGSKFFKTTDEAVEYLKAYPIKHATILIKGSRGMRMEKLREIF
ncbi:UDP-N-acetylmuramoyl-tripeptide--D-alanyl-D-alanine ligase [Pedobacter sp. P351]|uniref:UDP-N-acetylmuramoyl-tripeptide--D-alanyl-D- alanine ligase n=1 Tax=Pedobacter superstes TaxID=3133441 RepID=UPI0030A23764